MEKIKPGIVIDGQVIYPPGWMYILAFALRGCKWAVDEIESGRLDAAIELQEAIKEQGSYI